MRIKVKRFEAIYSAIWDDWEIETEEFTIKVKYLLVKNIDGIKTEYQRLKGINIEFDLRKIGKLRDGIVIVLSWEKLDKEKLWNLGNPDTPRNLAKTVTVR